MHVVCPCNQWVPWGALQVEIEAENAYAEQQFSRAESLFEEASKCSPASAGIARRLGDVRVDLRQYDAALQVVFVEFESPTGGYHN
jgi:hypothetical protein